MKTEPKMMNKKKYNTKKHTANRDSIEKLSLWFDWNDQAYQKTTWSRCCAVFFLPLLTSVVIALCFFFAFYIHFVLISNWNCSKTHSQRILAMILNLTDIVFFFFTLCLLLFRSRNFHCKIDCTVSLASSINRFKTTTFAIYIRTLLQCGQSSHFSIFKFQQRTKKK